MAKKVIKKTAEKRISGSKGKEKGLKNLKNGTSTRFSSTNQPPPENKSKGMRKYYALKDLLKLSLKGTSMAVLKKAAAQALSIEENDLTIEDLMHYRQIERAIKKSDTFAYNAVLDRAHGKPKQQISADGALISNHLTLGYGPEKPV